MLSGARDLFLQARPGRPAGWSPPCPAAQIALPPPTAPAAPFGMPPGAPLPPPAAPAAQHTVRHVIMEYSPGVAERNQDPALLEANPTALLACVRSCGGQGLKGSSCLARAQGLVLPACFFPGTLHPPANSWAELQGRGAA